MILQGLMKHFIELMRYKTYKGAFRVQNSVFSVSDQRHQVPENVERERESTVPTGNLIVTLWFRGQGCHGSRGSR